MFGDRLRVEGPDVRVRDGVYARSEILVTEGDEPRNGAETTFHSCVTTAGSILVEPKAHRVRFLSNVYADVANLQDTIIFGNLYARTCRLERCVVLGGVYAQRRLEMHRTLAATFSGASVHLGGDCGLFFPVAASGGDLTMDGAVRAFSFFSVEEAGLEDGEEGASVGGVMELGLEDVYRLDGTDAEPNAPRRVLSLDRRLLDGGPVMERFRQNRRFLERLSMAGHRERDGGNGNADLLRVEDRLMDLVNRDSFPPLAVESSFDEVMAREEVRGSVRDRFTDAALTALEGLAASRKRREREAKEWEEERERVLGLWGG
ncbi:MAG: hypothetical protein RH859_13235 [Longimicrobiales bacterium]